MPEAFEVPSKDMPGFFQALWQGGVAGAKDVGHSAAVLTGDRTGSSEEEQSAAAQPFAWSDALSPISRALPKIGYRIGQGSPTFAGGFVGSAALGGAGALTGPAAPVLAPVGAFVGGVGGAAALSAMQTLGPYFAKALRETPHDPEAAYQRAMHAAEIAGAFGGLGWALLPVRLFSGPVKQVLFQAFGVQPSVAMGAKATENEVEGQPITEGLGETYVNTSVTGLLPTTVRTRTGGKPPGNRSPSGAPPPSSPQGPARPSGPLISEHLLAREAGAAEETSAQAPEQQGADTPRSPTGESTPETPQPLTQDANENRPESRPYESVERNNLAPTLKTRPGESGEQARDTTALNEPDAQEPHSHELLREAAAQEQQADIAEAAQAEAKSTAEIQPPSSSRNVTADDLVPETKGASQEPLLRIQPNGESQYSQSPDYVPTLSEPLRATKLNPNNSESAPGTALNDIRSRADAEPIQRPDGDLPPPPTEVAKPNDDDREGPVIFFAPQGATAAEIDQVIKYVEGCEKARIAGALSPTGRVSTSGALEIAKVRAAKAERDRAKRAGSPYAGQVGHVPDTTWTGNPEPYMWMDLTRPVNSSLGRQALDYPIGYKPNRFIYGGKRGE